MEEGEHTGKEQILNSNDLAFERTVLGENRTLMAWIRTAISLISFGFTIYKFFHETVKTRSAEQFLTPRITGMIMIGFGLLALFWGLAEHNSMMKKLRKSYPTIEKSKAGVLAILILFFGLALFLAALFRQ